MVTQCPDTEAFMQRGIMIGLVGATMVVTGTLLTTTALAQSVADNYTPVTEDMLVEPPAEDWPMWRRTYGHWGPVSYTHLRAHET